MIKPLTIVYVTSRKEPRIEWFFDSLDRESGKDYSNTKLIVIDALCGIGGRGLYIPICPGGRDYKWEVRLPKPTIWQGEHRITKEDWWAKSNALNTGICLCETEWIAFVDDRSVLAPGWLHSIQDAMTSGYGVCGTYEKRYHLVSKDGWITDWGTFAGGDDRAPFPAPRRTQDWYGGSGALPLEWCLKVNGFPEDICDGLGFEDVAFGKLLKNNNLPFMFDSRMKIIEDRTPGHIDGALKRASKPSPNENMYLAKDYRILDIMNNSTTSQNSYNIREVREKVLRGESFPLPSQDHFDWFDKQLISEMI